jgi:alpha/beta superfamily hydrolase
VELNAGRPVAFTNSDGLKLEGLLHLSAATPCPGVVVAHPHPQYGGDMHNNVVHALCRAANTAGAAALRFNFRGAGGSEGAFDNGVGEQRDLAAALEYLRILAEVDRSRIALTGYSFGAGVALRLAPAGLRGLVAVSPPTIGGWPGGGAMDCATLLVAGDRDPYCDAALLERHRAELGDDVTVVVHPGVDHFWWGSDERLIETVSGFLREHL